MTGGEVRPATVVYDEGFIVEIDGPNAELGSMPVLDVGQLFVLPGLVDTHVHINEPGRSEWEGFASGSRAAAAGGYTCLVDMPLNCIPATTSVSALEQKRAATAGSCLVDHAFWGGAVHGNARELLPLAEAGVKGFKAFMVDSGVAEFAMVDEADLRTAMPEVARTGLPLLLHAEDPATIAQAFQLVAGDPRHYGTYLQSRPDAAEVVAIERAIRLCREHGCRVHIVHLSSAAALPALRNAREEGLPVTVETCPHYLSFTAEQVPDGATEFKCAPPIRSERNREQLWAALREGTIDLIATDHSPCLPAMKRPGDGDFLRAWGGIASLSLALPVVWTAATSRGFTMADVVRWMSEQPAKLAGLESHKGRIAPGHDADFLVLDADTSFTVERSDLYFRHPVCPYLGERLKGRVTMTILRGGPVFHEGAFIGECRGRECRVSDPSVE